MVKVEPGGLGIVVTQILEDYSKEVVDITNEEIRQVTKEAVAMLKATSPVRKSHSKGYAQAWTSKKGPTNFSGVETRIIYNRQGQLTHLLEYGHAIANGWGMYPGRTNRYIHIQPVEDWVNEELPKRIERKLSR